MGRVLVQQPGTNTAKALTETLPKNVIIVDEDLKELRLHDGVTPGGKLIGQSAGSGVPIGTIIPFAGNSVPQGYLLCDGSAISRTDYASLFAVIGTIYGAGDGNSTFNLPNLWERVPMGVWIGGSLGYMDDGQLPNISGAVTSTPSGYGPSPTGAFYQNGSKALGFANFAVNQLYIYMDASRSSSAYSRSDNFVIPRRLNVNYVIKY